MSVAGDREVHLVHIAMADHRSVRVVLACADDMSLDALRSAALSFDTPGEVHLGPMLHGFDLVRA